MTTQLANVTFDCDDVLKVANFWSAALGRDLDPRAGEWFASIGGADGARREPAWYFAKVPEAKSAKNRVHVDVVDDDPNAVERLVELGASVVGRHSVPGGSHHWTVMHDPEGNEFCLANKAFTGST
jgi:predicted enzyme related to lactoylglutathione lyase